MGIRAAPTDTIAAVATAPGRGGVAIVRISGPAAESVLVRCFVGLPAALDSHRLYLGRVRKPGSGEMLDEALAVLMRRPRSFTGEDVAEVHCHGGALNTRRVLEAILAAGARLATPGEFSLRAFLNGRLDLSQAEAIADIVDAESSVALRAAQAQLGGAVRETVERLRGEVLELLTLLEASLDFAAEEHVYQLDGDDTAQRIGSLARRIDRLLAVHEEGRLALGGVRVALVGAPNVGKSSLFNRLLGLDRAIVTEVPGTTRDILEESTRLGEQRLHVVDTAGLHESADTVELLGMARTVEAAGIADLLCWVVDANRAPATCPDVVANAAQSGRLICVVNKADLASAVAANAVGQSCLVALEKGGASVPVVVTSAATGRGLAELERVLAAAVARLQARSEQDVPMVTSARHAAALRVAREALDRGLSGLGEEVPLELTAADVREAADALGEIVGAIATDDVLAGIFERFCVGK